MFPGSTIRMLCNAADKHHISQCTVSAAVLVMKPKSWREEKASQEARVHRKHFFHAP